MILLSTFLVAVLSAIVPLVNVEAYLAVVAPQFDLAFTAAAVAAAGQMVGKTVWYYCGSKSINSQLLSSKLSKPKTQAVLAKWQARTAGRPLLTALILFLSAFGGFPPYAIMAVLAGLLGVPLLVFLSTGLVGRFLRFWALLEASSALMYWLEIGL